MVCFNIFYVHVTNVTQVTNNYKATPGNKIDFSLHLKAPPSYPIHIAHEWFEANLSAHKHTLLTSFLNLVKILGSI